MFLGLVLDIGAAGIRISPVVDGYVLKKSVISTTRGGDWMDKIVNDEIAAKYGLRLVPCSSIYSILI